MLKGGYQIIRFNPNIEITEKPVHVMFSYYDASHSYQKMTRISGMLYDGQLWDDFNIVFDRSNSDDLNGNIKAELVNGLLLLTKLHITSDSMVYITKEMLSVPESFVYREITKNIEMKISPTSSGINSFTIKLMGLYNDETNEMILTDYDIVNWTQMTDFNLGSKCESDLELNILNSITTISNIYFVRNMSWYSVKTGKLQVVYIEVSRKLNISAINSITIGSTYSFANSITRYFVNKDICKSSDTSLVNSSFIVLFTKNAYGLLQTRTNVTMADSNLGNPNLNISYNFEEYADVRGYSTIYRLKGYNKAPTTFKTSSTFTLNTGETKTYTGNREMQNGTFEFFNPVTYIPDDKIKFSFKIKVSDNFLDATATVQYSSDAYGRLQMTRTFYIVNNNEETVSVSAGSYEVTDIVIIN